MLRRAFFFNKQTLTERFAHNSPIHRELQLKLSEELEQLKKINEQLHTKTTEYLIKNYGEGSFRLLPIKKPDTTSFDNGLKAHKEKLMKNIHSLVVAIRQECEEPETPRLN